MCLAGIPVFAGATDVLRTLLESVHRAVVCSGSCGRASVSYQRSDKLRNVSGLTPSVGPAGRGICLSLLGAMGGVWRLAFGAWRMENAATAGNEWSRRKVRLRPVVWNFRLRPVV